MKALGVDGRHDLVLATHDEEQWDPDLRDPVHRGPVHAQDQVLEVGDHGKNVIDHLGDRSKGILEDDPADRILGLLCQLNSDCTTE
jgi:hypothetical protein